MFYVVFIMSYLIFFHRDLKVENLLLDENDQIKIIGKYTGCPIKSGTADFQ